MYLGLVLSHLGGEALGGCSHGSLAVPEGGAHEGEAPAQGARNAALPVRQQLGQLLRLLPGHLQLLQPSYKVSPALSLELSIVLSGTHAGSLRKMIAGGPDAASNMWKPAAAVASAAVWCLADATLERWRSRSTGSRIVLPQWSCNCGPLHVRQSAAAWPALAQTLTCTVQGTADISPGHCLSRQAGGMHARTAPGRGAQSASALDRWPGCPAQTA